MKLLVTGASGFLGGYVVAEALRRGHVVRAVVRPGADTTQLGWDVADGRLELVRADLRSRTGLVEAIKSVDVVVHLAAAKGGDVYAQYGGTVIATENLLGAMEQAAGETKSKPKLVHVSSFSVYDYLKPPEWSTLDENSAIEHDALDRDGYAHTKLVQERIVRDASAKNGWTLTVLRPGMIYGKDNLWNAYCGMQAGSRLWVRTGSFGRLALTYVENVAEAILLAAEKDEANGQTLNIVDDNLPSRRTYLKRLQEVWPARPTIVSVPWFVMRLLARSAWITNKVLFGNRAKLPGILIPCRLHARLKPLRYSNERIKRVLGWSPRFDLEAGIQRSQAHSFSLSLRVSAQREQYRAGVRAVSLANDASQPRNFPHPNPVLFPLRGNPEGEGKEGGLLRIAYLTGEYPRATDTFIQREIAALRSTGVHIETFSVRVPALNENVGPEQAAEKQNTFYLLPAGPLALLRSHASLLFRSPGRWLGGLKLAWLARAPGVKSLLRQMAYFAEAGLVARRMRERNIPHLHNHFADSSCTVSMLAAQLGNFPYSFTIHGPAEFFEPRRWRLDEKTRRASFVACISRFCRSQMMCFSRQADWDKLKIIHCGVNPADYRPAGHRESGSRLLFVGRLAGVKGVPVLLEALVKVRAECPNVTLRIAGDGPDRAALESLAARLGVSQNVQFLGYQTQSQVRALLQETDVFVMASFAEGVPVVLMEAMASGVPVVSTNIAGVPELVEDGISGLLVPPGDANAIAQRVSDLLNSPELRQRLAAAGRIKVEREFNLTTEAGRLRQAFIESLAGGHFETRPAVSVEPEKISNQSTASSVVKWV